ncbi:uncharacterized protein [Miscanthus floridulus]|uniref:uncharacterized protein n=1 Tax=Miscanthus floridulus TaxID=154761 RepID=UPI0034582E83
MGPSPGTTTAEHHLGFANCDLICKALDSLSTMSSRKYPSGNDKRKKKKQIDDLVESQRGALHKFLKSNTSTSRDPDALAIVVAEEPANANPEDQDHMEGNVNIDVDEHNVSDHEHVFNSNETEPTIIDEDPVSIDIYDPRNWDKLNNKAKDTLVEKGPIREENLEFPWDANDRHFSYAYYSRKMSNGESSLGNDGFRDWRHVNERRNLAFRGSNEQLYNDQNGNFLACCEMVVEFDSIVRRAKYFSVILDCTPDVSHQEQMSLLVRCVDMVDGKIKIEEYFLGFLKVDDTLGHGLFNVLVDAIKSLGLDIDDIRGQGYDNGSNMKGKHKGVQSRLLEINPRAKYVPCACHSLNLTLCDMAKSCTKADTFFGIVQRIYVLFAGSTKRWKFLLDHVDGLTVKSLCNTRWESRIKSVIAIRYQAPRLRAALLALSEDPDVESKDRSDAKNLFDVLGSFEFIFGMVIWHDILFVVNKVSKKLQSSSMCIDSAMRQIEGIMDYFETYRNNGFASSMVIAKEIASEMGVEPSFPIKRRALRKKHFDENNSEEVILQAEKDFKVSYFLVLVDMAKISLKSRFDRLESFNEIFGFLMSSTILKSLDGPELNLCCTTLAVAFSHNGSSDIDLNDLISELRVVQSALPERDMTAMEIFEFVT